MASDPHQLQQRTTGQGHNNPPPDPYLAQLEDAHASLLDQQASLELEAATLPKVVDNDDQVAAITAYVVKARALARRIEAEREDAKKPLLARSRTLDGFFGGLRDALKKRADGVEARNGPYLLAKRQRAEAEARARLVEAQRIADAAAERARLAREQEIEAQRVADEEAERNRRAAAEAQAQATAAELGDVEGAVDTSAAQDADQAEEASRAAQLQANRASQAATDADKLAGAAQQLVDTAQSDMDRGVGRLARTAGGGGASNVRMEWQYRLADRDKVRASLGPLGPYFSESEVLSALAKATRGARPAVPGVEYFEQPQVRTTAART